MFVWVSSSNKITRNVLHSFSPLLFASPLSGFAEEVRGGDPQQCRTAAVASRNLDVEGLLSGLSVCLDEGGFCWFWEGFVGFGL